MLEITEVKMTNNIAMDDRRRRRKIEQQVTDLSALVSRTEKKQNSTVFKDQSTMFSIKLLGGV